ncbi:MAG: hypothetical protein ACREM1_11545 [Longimicrobiales bacterium]
MNRAIRLFMLLILPVVTVTDHALAQDHAEGEPVKYTEYSGYFESNKSGLSGDVSLLAFTDQEDFDEIFGTVPLPPVEAKKEQLPENAFDSLMVVAVIHRGKEYLNYHVKKVTAAGGTLTVDYDTTTRPPPGTGSFAVPMILSVPKGPYKSVVFIENGSEAGTAEVD